MALFNSVILIGCASALHKVLLGVPSRARETWQIETTKQKRSDIENLTRSSCNKPPDTRNPKQLSLGFRVEGLGAQILDPKP